MNPAILRHPIALGLLALLAVIVAAATVTIVPETEQAVVVRLGRPVAVVNGYRPDQQPGETGAGVVVRVPFVDRLVWIDRRLIEVDADQQVLPSDQSRMQVGAFARFRVVNALRTVAGARSERGATDALRPMLAAALSEVLDGRSSQTLLGAGRDAAGRAIRARLQQAAAGLGVEIVDVRIRRAELPAGGALDAALGRMRTAREQQAAAIRTDGQRQALAIRAQADTDAAQIYSQSFSKDAEAYDFYRAMQSYRRTLNPAAKGSTSIVLSPNNAYLRQFETGGR